MASDINTPHFHAVVVAVEVFIFRLGEDFLFGLKNIFANGSNHAPVPLETMLRQFSSSAAPAQTTQVPPTVKVKCRGTSAGFDL